MLRWIGKHKDICLDKSMDRWIDTWINRAIDMIYRYWININIIYMNIKHNDIKKKAVSCFQLTAYTVNGAGGIWTLAPVARPTPLAGAPLQPLEYFSIIWKSSLPICYWRHFVTQKLLYIRSMCLSIAFFINCRYCL